MFTAPDLSLLHANGSSMGFDDAVERVGGAKEAVKMTRRDLWRNVRIPLLQSLPHYSEMTHDWLSVPAEGIPEYSSLIGVPIRGLPSAHEGNITFNIQTNYQALEVKHSLLCTHNEQR
jgi:hypothetical protein